jgi:5'-methylthioadenosine phosphorylase
LQADTSAYQCACRSALQFAIITAPEARDLELVNRLSSVVGRVLKLN